jgi:hypothetical protein
MGFPLRINESNYLHQKKVLLRELCCFCPGQCCDINYTLTVYVDRVPSGFIPIAYDPGGNLFVMSLSQVSYGAIYFWDHEAEVGDNEEPNMSNVYLLAESWADLFSKLI